MTQAITTLGDRNYIYIYIYCSNLVRSTFVHTTFRVGCLDKVNSCVLEHLLCRYLARERLEALCWPNTLLHESIVKSSLHAIIEYQHIWHRTWWAVSLFAVRRQLNRAF